MYLSLVVIIAIAWGIVELASGFKQRRLKPVILSAHAEQLQRRRYPSGIIAGSLSCILGLLGIYTYGLLFAPLGAVTGGFSLFHALGSHSFKGIALATLGLSLTLTAAVSSPSLWVAVHPYVSEAIAEAQTFATYFVTSIQQGVSQ